MMTPNDVVSTLKAMVDAEGTQSAVAKKLGISPMYLSDLIRKRREPGEKVLKSLGLVRVIVYAERRPLLRKS